MAGSRILLYGFSISFALLISIFTFFVRYYPYVLIPVLTYITSLGFNLLSKYVSCDEVAFANAAKNALFPTGMVCLASILVATFPSMKSPIQSLLPNALPNTQDVVGNTFYFFWAALYGQILGSGFSQICPVT